MKLKDQAKRTRDAIVETLQAHGADSILTVKRGKHPGVQFMYNGQCGLITFTLTPTDNRAMYNQITRAKRVIRSMAAER